MKRYFLGLSAMLLFVSSSIGLDGQKSANLRGPAYYPKGVNGPAIAIPELYAAVGAGNTERVRELLQKGADPNQRVQTGWVALHQAVYTNSNILRLLLDYGADPNAVVNPSSAGYSNKWTPLFFAVYLNKIDMVKELLKRGADPGRSDATGKTILQFAIETRDRDLVKLVEKALRERGKKSGEGERGRSVNLEN